MIVFGLIEIKNGLRVEAACLAQIFYLKILGIRGEIKTPSLPLKFTKEDYDKCRALAQPVSSIKFNNDIKWGVADGWPDGESVIYQLLFEFNFRSTSQKLKAENKIRNEFSSWLALFTNNLYARNFYVAAISIQESDDVSKHYRFYEKRRNIKGEKSFATKMQEAIINISYTLSKEDLLDVLIQTSKNRSIRSEYLYIKEADIALLDKNFRKAVLDSATALELCLNVYLKRNLKGNKEMIEDLLKENNSISKKRKLMKYTKITLPDYNFQRDIEDLRNKAIHAGKKPTETEARTAIKIVKEVLELLIDDKYENS